MQQAVSEQHLYDHANRLLHSHEVLLADSTRNRSLFRSLKLAVKQGMRVLDLGAGTGIWAVAAAMMGAGSAVAVEMDSMLIGVIRELAESNGVSNKVEVVQGHSSAIQLDGKFDLVITETIGNLAFEEQIVPTVIDARNRFLKTGGILIPDSVSLMVAPAMFAERRIVPTRVPIKFPFFNDLMLNTPIELPKGAGVRLLGVARELVRTDLYTVPAAPDLTKLSAQWEMKRAGRVNCFLVWPAASLGNGIVLSARNASSWKQTLYRIKPFQQSSGTLEFSLSLTSDCNYWAAVLSGKRQERVAYSPAQAAAALLAATQTGFNIAEHQKRIRQS